MSSESKNFEQKDALTYKHSQSLEGFLEAVVPVTQIRRVVARTPEALLLPLKVCFLLLLLCFLISKSRNRAK